MRASRLVLSLLGPGVLGCGSSDSSPPVDAFRCAQQGVVNVTEPLAFPQGSPARSHLSPDGTRLLVARVVVSNANPTTGFQILQINNAGVFSGALGKAGRFELPPLPGVYPLDTEADFGFGVQFLDGIGPTTISPTQVALLDPSAGGTVHIDSWAPAAMPGGTTTIGATITNAKFKGYNVNGMGTVDSVGNGCDITLRNFQFTGLTVSWQTAPFPTAAPPSGPPASLAAPLLLAAQALDGAAAVSADLRIE
jgi:hypothetical protein